MAKATETNQVQFELNGQTQTVPLRPKYTLLEYLRQEANLYGTKDGCAQGHCGTCTVLVNGKAELACTYRMDRLNGARVETIESVATDGAMHPIQQALVDHGAVQCGFCTPGMVMSIKALLARNANPTDAQIRTALDRNLCRCGAYPKILTAVHTAAAALRGEALPAAGDWRNQSHVIGARVPKLDAPAKACGQFVYADDIVEPGAGYAQIVWSEYPHAEIRAVHTAEAEAVEGVLAVLTSQSLPGRNVYGTVQPDQPVLCGEKVRYVGDVVALVVAETARAARQAAALVRVDYVELPGVFSPAEALAAGAPKLHEQGNLHARLEVRKGDMAAGFSGADVVVEADYSTPFVEHAYLEPEAGIATIDADGIITIRMASQFVGAHRQIVADCLGYPVEKINLVHVQPGGAFGAKNDISLHILLGLAALKTGRAVRMTLTRGESLRMHPKRHAMEIHLKLGATRDGTLTAMEADILADTGAYASEGMVVLSQAVLFTGGPYVIPNVSITGTTVYTNNVPAGAMRGFGIPEVAFATELAMDDLARQLGMDPFVLRERNALEVGSQTCAGQTLLASVPLKRTIAAAREALGQVPPPAAGRVRGVGVACSYKNVGVGMGLHMDSGGAVLELSPEGSLLVRIGGVDLGQGSDTTIAQIAAQATGVPFGQVRVAPVDVFHTPEGGVTSASRTTYVSGNAVVEASRKLRAALNEAAAAWLGVAPEDVQLRDGQFSNGGGKALALSEVTQRAAAEGRTFTASHNYEPPPTFELWHHGPPNPDAPIGSDFFFSYSYATQVAVVDVDTHLGQVEVVKIIAAHDVGRAINPQGIEAQIEGSCLMGMGYALTEEFRLDHGRLLTDNLKKCHIPTFKRAPEIVTVIVEEEEPTGPFGAKGIAEAAAIPTAPAILNAIYAATGARIRSLPATPMKVLDALHALEE